MVSEAEYDKNQEKFRAAQAAATSTQPGGTQPQGTNIGMPLLGAETQNIPGLGSVTSIDPFSFGAQALAGGGFGQVKGAGAGIAAQVGRQAQIGLSKKTIALLSGTQLFGAVIAAFMSVPNNIIGKQVNAWASENNIDLGNMRLNAFEQLYTIPVENPATGEWTYLFNDETQIRQRMAEAGVPKDQIDGRVIQLSQLRMANQEIIAAAGPLPQLRQIGQIETGELPFSAAQRINREQIKAAQEEPGLSRGGKPLEFGQEQFRFFTEAEKGAQASPGTQELLQKQKNIMFPEKPAPQPQAPGRLAEETRLEQAKAELEKEKLTGPPAPITAPTADEISAAAARGYGWDPVNRKWVRGL